MWNPVEGPASSKEAGDLSRARKTKEGKENKSEIPLLCVQPRPATPQEQVKDLDDEDEPEQQVGIVGACRGQRIADSVGRLLGLR